ncbi:MAG TPA: protein kinase, partial [Oscillatoriaceae cyanobacterium]
MASDIQQASANHVIGPYKVRLMLREGAFAQLFLADAFEDGRQLLIKRAREAGLKSELAFQREFALGSRLAHPHLGAVLDFGRAADGHPYLVLPFYPGTPLSELNVPCPESEILRVGVAIASALAEIHAHGWVHHDVSPANVLVESDGHVRLVDFGLLAPMGEPTAGACGTPLFLAPEALEKGTTGPAADLYALGVLLYRLACGKAPFEELAPEALLAAVLTTPPEPIQARAPHLPPALAGLLMRCLVKEPADRPASAEQLRDALLKIAGELPPLLGEGRWQPTAAFERWIGLDFARGVHAFVGTSGLGRSRHLREAQRHARRAARAACRFAPQEGDGPYGLLERLWRWAVAMAPTAAEELPLPVREAIAALWPWAFPHVRPVHDPGKLTRALHSALEALVPSDQLLLIDDWEAIDAASRAVLIGGFTGPLGERHWLLACRQAPPFVQPLALGALEREAFERWLPTCVSTRVPERLVARMWEFSEGNPGWAAAGLRHLLGTGQLGESGGWSLPETLEALLEAQWSRLSLEQRALAEVLALHALPFTTADLIPLAALLPANWPLELSKLVSSEFLVLDGGTYRFRQNVLAGWIRERMASPRRAKLAEQLARELVPPGEALRDPPQLYRLAMLFAQSDATAPRVQYALEAGRAYAGLFANEAALELFASGLAAIEQNPEPQRFRAQRLALRIAQADVQRLTGELDAAEGTYTACLDEVQEPAERGRLLVSLGKTRQMLNRFEPARDALEQALAVLAPLPAFDERLRALLALGRVLYYLGDREGAARHAHEALKIARAHNALQPLAEALSFLGNSLVEAGRLEGLDHLREALALRERLGDAQGTNDTHMLLGNALLQAGRFGEARAHFEANRALARQIGHRQEEAFACVNAALCECELGGWPEAAGLLEDVRQLAGRDDFLLGLARFIESFVRLQLGELPAVEECLKEAREREAQLGSAYLRL